MIALELDPEQHLAHVESGHLAFREGDRRRAAAHFRRALAVRPRDAETLVNLAVALEGQEPIEAIATHYRTALEVKPDWPEAADNFARLLLSRPVPEHVEEARRWAERASRLTGRQDARCLETLARAEAAAGHWVASANVLREAATCAEAHGQEELSGRLRDRLAQLAGNGAVLADAAGMLKDLGHFADAARYYELAAALAPDEPAIANNLAWLRATCPDAEVRDARQALRLAERLCAEGANARPEYLDTRAAAQAAAGHFAEAVETLDRAMESLGERPAVVAELSLRRGLYRQGKVYLQPPGGRAAAQVLAEVAQDLSRMGLTREAIRYYRESAYLRPDVLDTANNLAWLLATAADADARDPEEATELARLVCRIAGRERPEFLDTLAATQAAKGAYGEAAETIERALERMAARDGEEDARVAEALRSRLERYRAGRPVSIAGTSAVDAGELAEIARRLRAAGRTAEGIEFYRRALRVDSQLAAAANNLAWLLATAHRAEDRDPAEALRLARGLCDGAGEAHPAHLDTLASAQAACGDFADAAATVERATRRAEEAGLEVLVPDLRARRERYAAGREYVELRGGPAAAPRLAAVGQRLARAGRMREAAACYRRALGALPGLLQAANNLAWLLATSPGTTEEERAEALEVARRVCEATGRERFEFLDTLACAHAANGNFADAVRVADEAIGLAVEEERDLPGQYMYLRRERFENGERYYEVR